MQYLLQGAVGLIRPVHQELGRADIEPGFHEMGVQGDGLAKGTLRLDVIALSDEYLAEEVVQTRFLGADLDPLADELPRLFIVTCLLSHQPLAAQDRRGGGGQSDRAIALPARLVQMAPIQCSDGRFDQLTQGMGVRRRTLAYAAAARAATTLVLLAAATGAGAIAGWFRHGRHIRKTKKIGRGCPRPITLQVSCSD